MKKLLLFLLLPAAAIAANAQNDARFDLTSPDGTIVMHLSSDGDAAFWSLDVDGTQSIAPTPLSITLGDGSKWIPDPRRAKVSRLSADTRFASPFYIKSEVEDRYNALRFDFRKDGFALELRAYDDGAAYRFISTSRKPLIIAAEEAGACFDGDLLCRVPYVRDCDGTDIVPFGSQFKTSFENLYTVVHLSELDPQRLAFPPLTVETAKGVQLCFTESDVQAYPAMYLYNPDGGHALHAVFPPCPSKLAPGGYLQYVVEEYEDFIARAEPLASFPWRTVLIARNDSQLLCNDMVMRLAEPSRIADTSWIRPAKAAWEWWNDWGLTGVDFEAGINDRTYEYYIDFAQRFGLGYIVVDDGWSKDDDDLLSGSCDGLDLQRIIDYAAERNIGIILWAGYRSFERDMEEVCRRYSAMGVKGFKVDFMDRCDQTVTEFLYDAAETAARYGLMIDFHGVYKPSGLQRTWPNVVNFEGVHGMEQMKWSEEDIDQITYDVTMPYIRMVAGPVDYTPGAMINDAPGMFRPRREEPSSQGTRCRQIAQYVILHAPLSMMCDSPTLYEREPECTAFMADIPTLWDETRPLGGRIGEWVAVARRKGDVWYAAALTGHEARDITVDLGFLGEGDFSVELYSDGANARKHGSDYRHTLMRLPTNRTLTIPTAPGGGFALRITRMIRTTADSNATPETKALYNALFTVAETGTMFGHEDDTMYGCMWRGEGNRSDVREACGSYPAVFGWDIGHLETCESRNIDGVDFNILREDICSAYERGAVNTVSWHIHNPATLGSAWDSERCDVVRSIVSGDGETALRFREWLDRAADFFLSLEGRDGELIPILFRPFHEHTGSGFWWGSAQCTPEEFISLWRLTVSYLRDTRGVSNLLYVYSSDIVPDAETYLERYPGDEWVDVLGLDAYHRPDEWDYVDGCRRMLSMLATEGSARNKPYAFTETGLEGIPDAEWWTGSLLPAIEGLGLSWVLVWRNAPAQEKPNHYFAPWRGDASADDFVRFISDEKNRILLENNLPDMYRVE